MSFEQEYTEAIDFQAKYILMDLRITAENKDFEPDIFIRHVLNKVNELNKNKEVEE